MVKTFRGQEIDMIKLAKEYENTVALGNGHMNGRGDVLSEGNVVKTREEVLAETKSASVTKVGQVNMKENAIKEMVSESVGLNVAQPKKKTPKYEDITEKDKEVIDSFKDK